MTLFIVLAGCNPLATKDKNKSTIDLGHHPGLSNQAHSISTVGNQTTGEGVAVGPIAITIHDEDSVLTCANLIASSSNASLVTNANLVIEGTAPNCTLTITPTALQSGSTMITLTVTDGSLETQKYRMLGFVDLKNMQEPNWRKVIDTYVDDGFSAKDTRRVPFCQGSKSSY